MRALILVVLIAFVTHAYGKERHSPARPLPARAAAPAVPPAAQRWQAAPVPDLNIYDRFSDVETPMVTLFSAINHRPAPETGLAYAPGSSYQIDRDRRLFVPGIMVHVPLP